MGEMEKNKIHLRKPTNLKRETINTVGIKLRCALIFIDVLYSIVGGVIIGIGIRILVEKDNALAIFGFKLMSTAASVIIAAGAVVCVVAACGVAAVIVRNKILMILHIIAVAIILIITVVGGVVALIYREDIGERVRTQMQHSLQNIYGVDTGTVNNAHITEVWDKLQREQYCCGVDDRQWQIYHSSKWFHTATGEAGVDKAFVPISCCVYNHHGEYLDADKCQHWEQGPPGKQGGKENEALHYRGCFNASGMLGLIWFVYFAIVSFVGSAVVIVGLILSVFYYRQLGK